MSNKNNECVLLFSGGRDSSLVACKLASRGDLVHLLTCDNKANISKDYSYLRYKELKKIFPGCFRDRIIINSSGLFRRIAIENIENDFRNYKYNLILLGSQLAIHCEAIIYCKKNNIKNIYSGFTKYQKHLPEQMQMAIKVFTAFLNEFKIEYLIPIYDYESENSVKYELLDFGLSTKSLESISLFSDTFSVPDEETVKNYLLEKNSYL